MDQVIRPSKDQNNFIGDVVSLSINDELLGKGQEELIKAADPLMLFGMDITKYQGNYGRIGDTITYAPPEKDVE